MKMIMVSKLCSFTEVTEPLQLFPPNEQPFTLPLQQILNDDNSAVNCQNLNSSDLIEVLEENSQKRGIVRKNFKQRPICELGPVSLPSNYTHFSKLPVGSPFSSIFLSVLELSLLLKTTKPLESFLQWNLESGTHDYAMRMKESLTSEILDRIVSEVKMQVNIINEELLAMKTKYYEAKSGVFPYSEIQSSTGAIPNETWEYHSLASMFDVVIEIITPTGSQEFSKKRYYPNTTSVACPKVTLYRDAWLHDKEAESLMVENLFVQVSEVFHRCKEFAKSEEISSVASITKEEKIYFSCLSIIDSSPSSFDKILLYIHSQATSLNPTKTLLKEHNSIQKERRMCSKCKYELKVSKFPLPKVFKSRVYELECTDVLCIHCLEVCVRNGSGFCPVCNRNPDIHEQEVMAMECVCAGCSEKKNLLREFPVITCMDHRFCIKCVSKMKNVALCTMCKREYSAEEQDILEMLSALECMKCKQPVHPSRLIPNKNESCECVLCKKCLASLQLKSTNILQCPQCAQSHIGEEIIVQSYLNAINSTEKAEFPEFQKYHDEAQVSQEKFPECPVCYGEIVSQLTKLCSGMCLHVFHKDCLKESIEFDIQTIIKRDLRRPVKCPINCCNDEVSTTHLTGPMALIPEELFDEYGLYITLLTHKQFICSRCKKEDYIDKELEHFICEGCNVDQCTTCGVDWTPDHNDRACKFSIIEQMIRDRFPENCECGGTGCARCQYSQCPNCKLPYLKNEHSDHVICMNPECKAVFCFQCACYRSPTLEHCNTWHRRQCPNFPRGETVRLSQRIIKVERYREKCTECRKIGKLCAPPPNLKQIRRFALEEY